MKKRILSILTVLALCLTLLPTVALAGVDEGGISAHANHCICGATHVSVGDHTANAVPESGWTAWNSSANSSYQTALPTTTGYYYLTEDVQISTNQKIPFGSAVVLCLNGHKITVDNSSGHQDSILIEGTLTITDCQNDQGTITAKEFSISGTEKVIVVSALNGGGTLNLYGGTITRINAGNYNGGGVHNEGTFNMYGGKITGNKARDGGGVCNFINKWHSAYADAVFNMYGGTISDNIATRYGGGVYTYKNGSYSGRGIFNLYGGIIQNNDALYGDDVYNTEDNTINANGGIVAGDVLNEDTITTVSDYDGTTFHGILENYGTISGGTYNGAVINTDYSTVSGSVTNNGVFVFESGSSSDGAAFTGSGFVMKETTEGLKHTNNNNEPLSGALTVNNAIALYAAASADNALTSIKLGAGIALDKPLQIRSGRTLTLDLNGKTLSMNDSSGAECFMIKNFGNLTIKDSGSGGKITFQSTTPSNENNYSASTIGNGGILTVKNGTIENTTVSGSSYTIDTLSYTADTEINIEGGTISCSAPTAIRQIPRSTTLNNTLNISGGTITGKNVAVQTHDFITIGGLATVNISGGTLTGNNIAYYTYYTHTETSDSTITRDGRTSHSGTSITITDGIFNGDVYIFNHTAGSSATQFQKVEISGGTFNAADSSDRAAVYVYTKDSSGNESCIHAITGGIFACQPYGGYIANGYDSYQRTNNTYGVAPTSALDQKADLTLTVTPADATVVLKQGDTVFASAAGTVTLPGGDYTLTVSKTGYQTVTQTITVSGEDLAVSVTLSPSSSSSGAGTHSVTVKRSAHGSVRANVKSAARGNTVTLTVAPDSGYTLKRLTVLDQNGDALALTDKGDGTYSFKMPAGNVTIQATFVEDTTTPNFFEDVPTDAYYYDAVLWAVRNEITGGVDSTHFAPDRPCTRAQLVTFLYRAAVAQGIDVRVGADTNILSYTDAPEIPEYAITAFQWAAGAGIIQGNNGALMPNDTCTRAQFVAILFRFAAANGTDAVTLQELVSSYADASDVPGYALSAFNWTLANRIVNGSDGNLMPNTACTRAQIVTMLYRLLGR